MLRHVDEAVLSDHGVVVLLGPLQYLHGNRYFRYEVAFHFAFPCCSSFASVKRVLGLRRELVVVDATIKLLHVPQWPKRHREIQRLRRVEVLVLSPAQIGHAIRMPRQERLASSGIPWDVGPCLQQADAP